MVASPPPMPEGVRVIWSASLVQGLGAGFALIVRSNRIAGAKKFTQEHYVADLGLMPGFAAREKALKVLADLERGKKFEFTKDEIVRIEMSEPGRFGPGRIVFKTTRGEETVKVAGSFGTGSGSVFAMVQQWLEAFAPGKVQKLP